MLHQHVLIQSHFEPAMHLIEQQCPFLLMVPEKSGDYQITKYGIQGDSFVGNKGLQYVKKFPCRKAVFLGQDKI